MDKELIESYRAIIESYMLLPNGDITIVCNKYTYPIYVRGWGIRITMSGDNYIECAIDRIFIRNKQNPNNVQAIGLQERNMPPYISPENKLMIKEYIAELAQVYQALQQNTTIARKITHGAGM